VASTQNPEDQSWADYCDALHAEYWSRLLNAAKLSKRRRQQRQAILEVEDSKLRESLHRDPDWH